MRQRNHLIMRHSSFLAMLLAVSAITLPLMATPLPLPDPNIPDAPPLLPSVVSHDGKRLLLESAPVSVHYDILKDRLVVTPEETWLINFPLDQIGGLEGLSKAEIAEKLFQVSDPANLVNWYLMTPGIGGDIPDETGPAPIIPSTSANLYVNNQHPSASDSNTGTDPSLPLMTIQEAVNRAGPGSTIKVYPGIYREAVSVSVSGTESAPIILEGVRDDDGTMPVITGNDLFPSAAWEPVSGMTGVYRANHFTDYSGTVSNNGTALIERSIPAELQGGDCCFNRASYEFLNLRYNGSLSPSAGQAQDGHTWLHVSATSDGYLDFDATYGSSASGSVFWVSTWLWVPPADMATWNPNDSGTLRDTVVCDGPFRAARNVGSKHAAQVQKYRLWANGQLLDSVLHAGPDEKLAHYIPNPHRLYGSNDKWGNFTLNEGWNHLVFQFDTSIPMSYPLHYRFGLPEKFGDCITQAGTPASLNHPPASGTIKPYLSEFLVLGPFDGSNRDGGIYARLPDNTDPDLSPMDLSARPSELVSIHADFVQLRGFELQGGSQYQQRGQIFADGEGIRIEGNLLRDSQFSGIRFLAEQDQTSSPLHIVNNWIIEPGDTGIHGSSLSTLLTAQNQNTTVPGRSPVLIEHNRIINSNWACIAPLWESGGMKFFRLTGAVIRNNTILDGNGPGIWFDTEHFNNRVEGNYIRNVLTFGIGLEASPGPNLVVNNIISSLHPANNWFRWGILGWSTNRAWAYHNTIDGKWDQTPCWQNKVGTGGIWLGQDETNDRGTLWEPFPASPQHTYYANAVAGCDQAIQPNADDTAMTNATDSGTGATALGDLLFVDQPNDNFNLTDNSPLISAGMDTGEIHDFYGLLRFPVDGNSAGACRAPYPYTETALEYELADGSAHASTLPPLLAGWWRLDESTGSIQDSSSSSQHGIIQGNPILGTGMMAGDLNFDGVDDAVVITNNLNFGTTITLCAWIKRQDITSDATILAIYGDVNNCVYMRIKSGGAFNGVADASGSWPQYDVWGGTIPQNEWHHLAMVVDGVNLSLYVDGVLTGTGLTPAQEAISGEIRIGMLGTGWSPQYFKGEIDDVRIYSSALHASDIAELYSNSRVAGWWSLDEPGGTMVRDCSINSQDGTIQGNPIPGNGIVAGSLDFDGIDDAIVIPNNLTLGTQATFCTWINPEYTGSDATPLAIYGSVRNCAFIRIDSNGTLIGGTDVSGSWPQYDVRGGTISENEWHHVALVIDGVDLALYLDGVLVGTSTIPRLEPLSGEIRIGKMGTGWSPQYFKGSIDDVRIYAHALNAEEIASICAASQLAGWWPLDNNVGEALVDYSPYAQNGIMQGNPAATTGIVAGALICDGIDDAVVIENNLNLGTEATLSAWIRRDQVSSDTTPLAIYDSVNNCAFIRFDANGTLIGGTDASSFWPRYDVRGGTLPVSEWHHVALVIDNVNLRLYVDGSLTGSSIIPSLEALTGEIRIGMLGVGWSPQYFKGKIDDVRIYSRALSTEQLLDLFLTP